MTEALAPAVYEAWRLFSSGRNSVQEIAQLFPELDIFPSSCIHDMYVLDEMERLIGEKEIFVRILSKDGMSYKEYAYSIPVVTELTTRQGHIPSMPFHEDLFRVRGALFDLRKAMFETCSLGKALQILKANFDYELIGHFTLTQEGATI